MTYIDMRAAFPWALYRTFASYRFEGFYRFYDNPSQVTKYMEYYWYYIVLIWWFKKSWWFLFRTTRTPPRVVKVC
jgi:hypothetical protein